uniref:Uncharacterized protein n=1 Tax=Oryza rufipogon TaxID=4529 RepID=A0A0E0QG19_ORYRU
MAHLIWKARSRFPSCRPSPPRWRRFPTSGGKQPAADAPSLLLEDPHPSAVVSAASATAAALRREASAPARSTAPLPPGLRGEQTTGKIRDVAIEEKAYHQQSAINHADIMHANDYQKLRLEEAEASQAA